MSDCQCSRSSTAHNEDLPLHRLAPAEAEMAVRYLVSQLICYWRHRRLHPGLCRQSPLHASAVHVSIWSTPAHLRTGSCSCGWRLALFSLSLSTFFFVEFINCSGGASGSCTNGCCCPHSVRKTFQPLSTHPRLLDSLGSSVIANTLRELSIRLMREEQRTHLALFTLHCDRLIIVLDFVLTAVAH